MEEAQNRLWEMFFDGSKNKNGASGGIVLVSPSAKKYYASFCFSFACSNNVVKYEGLIQGLEWARKRGIECIKVYGDTKLIVNQGRGLNTKKMIL